VIKKILSFSIANYLLGIILVAAIWLRFYNLPNSVQFLGDQGRDVIIMSQIFTDHNFPFIGPVMSVGNIYLGPLFYYLMVPWLWLSYPSPMGPVYAIVTLSVIAVWLTYYLGKDLVGRKAALWAAFFFTFSQLAILFGRFSWNPNPAPFVSIIMVWATFKAWKKSIWYWPLVTLCFSILIQLHYVILLAAGGAGVIWLIQTWQFWRQLQQKQTKNKLTQWSQYVAPIVVSILIFVVSLTPLILFDLKHQFLNAKAFQAMFFTNENFAQQQGTNLAVSLARVVKETHGRSMHILFEHAIGKQRSLNTLLTILMLSSLAWLWLKKKRSAFHDGQTVLLAYLLTAIVGTSFYQHTIFDHYILYLLPVVFLLYGVILDWLWPTLFGKSIAFCFVIIFLWFNLTHLPLHNIGWRIDQINQVSQSIYQKVKPGEKYNIVLLSETGDIDAQNYRYFLTTTDRKPVTTEHRGEVETLFIINEDRKLAKVTDSPVYEIVVFPQKNPSEIYEIPGGPEITVLRK